MLPKRCYALLLLGALLCANWRAPTLCRAEPEPARYGALVDAALEEYELAHFEEAMSLFEKAHEITPSARTLRGMGLASFQARKYVIAVGYLRAALEDSRKPLTPPLRREVQAALESSLSFIATFSLDLKPAYAALTVDGAPVAVGPSMVLSLDPGDHEIVATASGHQSETRHVSATAGRQGRVILQLEPVAPTLVPQARVSAEPSTASRSDREQPLVEHTPTGIKVLTIGGLSLALVGGAVGLGAGLKTLSEEDKLHSLCPDKKCAPDQANTIDDTKTWGNVATASLITGGAGLVAGIVGLVLWTRRSSRERAASHLRRWTLLPLGTGLNVSGRF